jgi:GTP cyclohydrolase II
LAEPPTASVRRQVPAPLRFPDGYATRAQVFTFDGLIDGGEHLAAKAHHFTRVSARQEGRLRCPS